MFGAEQQIATPGALTAQELLQGFKSTRLQLPREMAMGILSPWRGISQTQSCQTEPIQLQPRLQIGAGGLVRTSVEVESALGLPQRSLTHRHSNRP